MISFWIGLGIGVGVVFGVFLAVGLGMLVCYVAGLVWGLIKAKTHWGF